MNYTEKVLRRYNYLVRDNIDKFVNTDIVYLDKLFVTLQADQSTIQRVLMGHKYKTITSAQIDQFCRCCVDISKNALFIITHAINLKLPFYTIIKLAENQKKIKTWSCKGLQLYRDRGINLNELIAMYTHKLNTDTTYHMLNDISIYLTFADIYYYCVVVFKREDLLHYYINNANYFPIIGRGIIDDGQKDFRDTLFYTLMYHNMDNQIKDVQELITEYAKKTNSSISCFNQFIRDAIEKKLKNGEKFIIDNTIMKKYENEIGTLNKTYKLMSTWMKKELIVGEEF